MTELALMEGFSVPERAQWLALVEKALKGADFDRRLVARTADGLRIAPLYGRSEAPDGRLTTMQPPEAAQHLDAKWDVFLDNLPDIGTTGEGREYEGAPGEAPTTLATATV